MEGLKTTYFLFVITEIVNVSVIRSMMCCFFDSPPKTRANEFTGYFLYYVFHLSAHLLKIGMISCLTGQAVLLSAITFFYPSDLRTKLCTSFFVPAAVLLSDMAFLSLGGCFAEGSGRTPDICCIWGCLASKLALMAAVRIFTAKERREYSRQRTAGGYLLMTAAVPGASLYIFNILAQNSTADEMPGCVLCIIVLNGTALAFYFRESARCERKMPAGGFRNDCGTGAGDPASSASWNDDLRIFRHDMLNHFAVLEYHLKNQNSGKSLEYLQNMIHLCRNQKPVRTGNSAADVILERKVAEACQKGISVTRDITLAPSAEIPIGDFDLTCILGNLLDNAIEAAQKAPEKEIHIVMKKREGYLLIAIQNTFLGGLLSENGFPATTKKDRGRHGIGLRSVAGTVKKLNGSLDLRRKDGYFCASVKIYTK